MCDGKIKVLACTGMICESPFDHTDGILRDVIGLKRTRRLNLAWASFAERFTIFRIVIPFPSHWIA